MKRRWPPRKETEETDARTRAAARISARAAADAQEGQKRILVTPAQSTEPEKDETAATEPVTASGTAAGDGESGESSETWEALLLKLEREGAQMDAPTLATVAEQLEAMAATASNKLEAWQRLGDVYQGIAQTDRAMRAYMRALDSSSKSQGS